MHTSIHAVLLFLRAPSVKGIRERHFHTVGSVCVFERVLVFVCGDGDVAKGMPWLRGASQPADCVSRRSGSASVLHSW